MIQFRHGGHSGGTSSVSDERGNGLPRRSRLGIAFVVCGLLVGPLAVAVSDASAAPKLIAAVTDCPTYSSTFGPNTIKVVFSYRAAAQTWIVPSNAIPNSICFDASGGQGGSGTGGAGGTGGTVNEALAVSTGQTVTISVGQVGSSAGSGAMGGGGTGGTGAGGGGGSTQIFDSTGNTLLLAAAGGGGGGSAGTGGAGGQLRREP